MDFANPDQLIEYVKEMEEADSTRRGELERVGGLAASYHGGVQWGRVSHWTFNQNGSINRLPTNNDPETGKLRVTRNRVALNVQKSEAATFPSKLYVDVAPADRAMGVDAQVNAQLYQDVLNDLAPAAGFTAVRREVNFQRTIWGSYGLGIRVRSGKRSIKLYGSEQELADSDVEFFAFPPIELILDPHVTHRELRMHEVVIHQSVFSANKARRWLGDTVQLNEDRMKTVGDLAPFYLAIWNHTDGQLFAPYARNSRTKGVRIKQAHFRDESGRFSRMYIIVEGGLEKDKPECINFDNPETPFGGHGLGLTWYHAHRRVDGPFGLSDVAMMKDDQDKLNLNETWWHRQGVQSSGWRIRMDVRALPRGNKGQEEFKNAVNNSVGGPLFYDSGTATDKRDAPEVMQLPQPQSALAQASEKYEAALMDDVHRAAVNSGQVKSHTSEAVVNAAIEESGKVLGTRVVQDVETDGEILTVLMGTTIQQVKQMSPCTLGRLRRADFSSDDLARLYESDPVHIPFTITVREGSVRYRSPEAKREEIKAAGINKIIAPATVRMGLAELDMALNGDDALFEARCNQIAAGVKRGRPFTPMSLGEYSNWLLAALYRALMDPALDRDPAARQRVEAAVESQEQYMLAKAAAAQAAQVQPGAGAADQAENGTQDVGNMALEQVMAQLGGGQIQPAGSAA